MIKGKVKSHQEANIKSMNHGLGYHTYQLHLNTGQLPQAKPSCDLSPMFLVEKSKCCDIVSNFDPE